MRWKTILATSVALILCGAVLADGEAPKAPIPKHPFGLRRGRFGTLGAPKSKKLWDMLGAAWFKAGDCFWQGGQWVRDGGAQAWLLVRPRMFFTGNNRLWNPKPKPPIWQYRDKTRKFIRDNKDRIGILGVFRGDRHASVYPRRVHGQTRVSGRVKTRAAEPQGHHLEGDIPVGLSTPVQVRYQIPGACRNTPTDS